MGRDLIWGSETNWLHKSDTKVFVSFTRKLKVGFQWIYSCWSSSRLRPLQKYKLIKFAGIRPLSSNYNKIL